MNFLLIFSLLAVASAERVAKGFQDHMTYMCTFKDDLCGFHSNVTQMEWIIKEENSERFLLSEAHNHLDMKTHAISRCYTVTSPELCLSFRQKLTGSDDVQLSIRQLGGNKYQTWQTSKTDVNKGWTGTTMDVSLLPLQSKVQFVFTANLNGAVGNSVAIDDVTLTPTAC